ncbi:lysozyme [Tabrizicola sp. YIM 78059]|uniref:lysozyme n=1 Tax=Tabrizicola sp. YIM 78059 TaxID=2529861 RepID=UPI0010AAFAE5
MQTSPRGLVALVRHEGIVPAPYRDAAGVWTWGIGHAETSGLAPNPRLLPRGMPPDWRAVLPETFCLFRARLAPYEAGVRQAMTVPLKQHEWDALVSLCFNIGPQAFARSSVVRHLNAGNRPAAADAFRAWNRAGGRMVEGLVRRRAEERALFLTGGYPSGPIPVYSADAEGRLGGVIARLSEAEVLAVLDRAGGRSHDPALPPASPAPGWRDRLVALFANLTRRA